MPSTQQPVTVTPSTLKDELRICIAAKRPALVWGEPGIGKSQIVRQLADELYADDYPTHASMAGTMNGATPPWFLDMRLSQYSDVDLRGVPSVENGRTVWNVPAEFPHDGRGIWFCDEINRALTSVQNAAMQLVLDRRIGSYVVPNGWALIAAANRDGGGVQRINEALRYRFAHFNLVVDANDWYNWAISNGIHPMVGAFAGKFRPDLLHQSLKDSDSAPNPRAWEFVSQLITDELPYRVLMPLLEGVIGHGATVEFLAFWELYTNLPNMTEIRTHPSTAAIPADIAARYAVASALAVTAAIENWSNTMVYLLRMPEEFSVFAIKVAINRVPALARTIEYIRWATTNKIFNPVK